MNNLRATCLFILFFWGIIPYFCKQPTCSQFMNFKCWHNKSKRREQVDVGCLSSWTFFLEVEVFICPTGNGCFSFTPSELLCKTKGGVTNCEWVGRKTGFKHLYVLLSNLPIARPKREKAVRWWCPHCWGIWTVNVYSFPDVFWGTGSELGVQEDLHVFGAKYSSGRIYTV